MGDIDRNDLTFWYFTESCILIEDCPHFLNESERLGNWNINFKYYSILIFLSLNSSELYSVTSEGSFPVNSEDYTELYDSLNDQYCDEDKVCCPENVRILHQILLLSLPILVGDLQRLWPRYGMWLWRWWYWNASQFTFLLYSQGVCVNVVDCPHFLNESERLGNSSKYFISNFFISFFWHKLISGL